MRYLHHCFRYLLFQPCDGKRLLWKHRMMVSRLPNNKYDSPINDNNILKYTLSHLNTTGILAPSIATGTTSFHLSTFRYEGEVTIIAALKCRDGTAEFFGVTIIDPRGNFDFNIGRIEAIGAEVEVDATNIANGIVRRVIVDSYFNARVFVFHNHFHRSIASREGILNCKFAYFLSWHLYRRSNGRL